jgi:hypothetical protein
MCFSANSVNIVPKPAKMVGLKLLDKKTELNPY